MNFLASQSPTLLGLHIRSEAIYLLQLQPAKTGQVVTCVGYAPFAENIFHENKIITWSYFANTLLQLVQKLKLKNAITVIMLPTNLVHIKSLSIPIGMPDDEIAVTIQSQVQQDFPGMRENLWFDYALFESEETNYHELFFAATRAPYVEKWVTCIETTGLQVVRVDIEHYALVRAITNAHPLKTNEYAACLYVTAKVVTLSIFNAKKIVFMQQWNLNEQTFIEQFQQYLQHYLQRAMFPIKQLIFCGMTHYRTLLLNHQAITPWPFTIIDYQPLLQLQCLHSQDQRLLVEHSVEFLLAYAAATQEILLW